MPGAPVPTNEAARLLDLARYHVLDTEKEEVFDRITRLASQLLQVPIAAINFIDVDRHWNKSNVGFDVPELPREASFCAWAILRDQPLVIPDLTQDDRFDEHPAVTGEHHLRLYAGTPLQTPSGHRIGTLCIMDTQVRTLNDEALHALQDLAALATRELEWRAFAVSVQGQVNARGEYEADLRRSLTHAHTLDAIHELMDLPLEPQEVALQAAALVGQALHTDWTGLVTVEQGVPQTQIVHASDDLHPTLQQLTTDLSQTHSSVTTGLADLNTPYYVESYPDHPSALPEAVEAGLRSMAWVPLGRWLGTSFLLMTGRTGQARRLPWRNSDRVLLEAAGRSVRAAILRRAALDAERRTARQDALTTLLNRRAFDEDLAQYWVAGTPFTLVMMDLDGFKALNDTEGHAQGDKILRLFGQGLVSEVDDRGQSYRLGGDEFVLLLPGEWDEAAVYEVTDMAVLNARQGTVRSIGTSVGIVQREEAGNAARVVELADARMYEAKRRRKALRTEA
ncbi:sensor domain-containing diguanylate cyclase [Deinococcus alpinitundrae]|uniref:sensor domain-containing diguanylate cyclase n=1 Tax=Deinococcus alpinitundrae TaxID=468913 RepID=UPI00137A6F9A|nr:sensor domain-containing diguanylate cyclase [Deinococcus alpinitundrae]